MYGDTGVIIKYLVNKILHYVFIHKKYSVNRILHYVLIRLMLSTCSGGEEFDKHVI